LLASVDVIEFQTTDAYSSLDLTNVLYNLSIHSIECNNNNNNNNNNNVAGGKGENVSLIMNGRLMYFRNIV
jgi:hypothetical protein